MKKCKLCHTKQAKMIKHLNKVHKTDKHFLSQEISGSDLKYGCDICDARFVSKESQSWHKMAHSLETKCFYCDFVADNLKGFQKHCLEVHGKQDEDMGSDKVKCMYCEKVMKKDSIYAHRHIHNSEKQQCQLCYASLNSKKILLHHVRDFHKSDIEKSFLEKECPPDMLTISCEKCEVKFLTDQLLVRHKSREHGTLKIASNH